MTVGTTIHGTARRQLQKLVRRLQPPLASKKIEPPDLMVIPGVFVKLVYHH